MFASLVRLCFDPEIKEVEVDSKDKKEKVKKKVLNCKVAINNSKNNSTFIEIVAWQGTAELIFNHIKKGDEFYLEGKLMNTKKKKNEVEYETVAILVNEIKFVHGNARGASLDDVELPSDENFC